jgi:hypothetical protein
MVGREDETLLHRLLRPLIKELPIVFTKPLHRCVKRLTLGIVIVPRRPGAVQVPVLHQFDQQGLVDELCQIGGVRGPMMVARRVVVIRPDGGQTGILLARADGDEQASIVG